jgi:hypothetical protein
LAAVVVDEATQVQLETVRLAVQVVVEVTVVQVVLPLQDKEMMAEAVVHLAVAVAAALAQTVVMAELLVVQEAQELPLTLLGQVQHHQA